MAAAVHRARQPSINLARTTVPPCGQNTLRHGTIADILGAMKCIGDSMPRAATLLALALFPAMALAASPTVIPGRTAPERLEELSEVIVSGEKPINNVRDLIPWIRRLLGQYTLQGYVDVGGKGNPEDRHTMRGIGTCIGFGVAPGVQCEINTRWAQSTGSGSAPVPESVAALAPAMILYGVEPDELGIRYLQVDNRGLAEGATGDVIGNTATFRARCVDMAEACERVTRITAVSESKVVDVQVDTEVGGQLALRYRFQMQRVAEVQAPPAGAGR